MLIEKFRFQNFIVLIIYKLNETKISKNIYFNLVIFSYLSNILKSSNLSHKKSHYFKY